MMVTPLRADPGVWERFGVKRDGRRHKVVRPSVAAKRAANSDKMLVAA